MLKILRQYSDGDEQVTEYTRDGSAVSHTVRTPIQTEQPEPESQKPVETMEEKVARLESIVQEHNLIQMEVLATIFEEIVGGA